MPKTVALLDSKGVITGKRALLKIFGCTTEAAVWLTHIMWALDRGTSTAIKVVREATGLSERKQLDARIYWELLKVVAHMRKKETNGSCGYTVDRQALEVLLRSGGQREVQRIVCRNDGGGSAQMTEPLLLKEQNATIREKTLYLRLLAALGPMEDWDDNIEETPDPVEAPPPIKRTPPTPKAPPSWEIGSGQPFPKKAPSGHWSRSRDASYLESAVDQLNAVYDSAYTNHEIAPRALQDALLEHPLADLLAWAAQYSAGRDPSKLTGLHNWLRGKMWRNIRRQAPVVDDGGDAYIALSGSHIKRKVP